MVKNTTAAMGEKMPTMGAFPKVKKGGAASGGAMAGGNTSGGYMGKKG